MNRNYFGINFGTTETAIAYMNENLIHIVGLNSEGSLTTPSIVYFEDKSEIVVGSVAKGAAMWAIEKYIVHGSQWSDTIQDIEMEEIKNFSADSKTYFTYDEFLDICKHSSGFSEYLKRKNAGAD